MTSVVFLGTSAASPSIDRGFSCIAIGRGKESIIMDCGDGATRNILKFGPDVCELSGILITHHHSDHISGLTQLIETMSIKRRELPLTVFGPRGLWEYFSNVQKITNVASSKKFNLTFEELVPNQRFRISNYDVTTFEMDHTLPCLGYRVMSERAIVSFTGDTQPCRGVSELGRNSSLLIHEATYLRKDLDKARSSKHSTPEEGAEAALLAKTDKLILTHINDSCESPDEIQSEAGNVFKNVQVAFDGLEIEV
jgi:ribonuclease Z